MPWNNQGGGNNQGLSRGGGPSGPGNHNPWGNGQMARKYQRRSHPSSDKMMSDAQKPL